MRRDYNISQFIQIGGLRRGNSSASDGSGDFLLELLAVVLGRVGEHRNVARLVVELQHRQHLEAVGVVDADAQDDQVRLHALDLRIRVLARLDEHDVVVTGVEHRLEQLEHLRAAVDDDHFLRRASRPRRAVGGDRRWLRRWSSSLVRLLGHSRLIQDSCHGSMRGIRRHFRSSLGRADPSVARLTPKGCTCGGIRNPLTPWPFRGVLQRDVHSTALCRPWRRTARHDLPQLY